MDREKKVSGSGPGLGLKKFKARAISRLAFETAQAWLGFPGPAWAGLGLRAQAGTSLIKLNGHAEWVANVPILETIGALLDRSAPIKQNIQVV